MSKIQGNEIQVHNSKELITKPKIAFIGKNKILNKKVRKFAKDNNLRYFHYSEEEWVTLEEIDQYIQEEELSKQIVDLPFGKRTVSSLSEMEAKTIKKVVESSGGNMKKAARVLKIARATLYRKIEKYGLNLKKRKEKQFKQQEKDFKKAA